MDSLYRKYSAREVILFHFRRELTDEEVEKGIILNEHHNVPTGNEFVDVFAALIRKFGWAPLGKYADAMGLNKLDMNLTVRALTGQTVNEWVYHYTLLGVYELLGETNKSLTEVAKAVGLSDSSALCSFCKAYTKRTPLKLRQKLQREKAKGATSSNI